MAERKFDYNNVSNVYNQMKSINSDIKGLLENIDAEVEKNVNVEDEAIFGDLGAQLLLSWENISSDFPEFVDNFDNWAALVAKASGDYSQFERDVAAFKNANPLGVTSAGITQGQVSTSSYNNSYTAEEIEQLDAYARFYEQTGAEYIDTGMVEYAKKHKTMNIVGDVINVASIALSVFQVGSAVKAAKAAATPAVKAAAGTADDAIVAAVKNGDDVAKGAIYSKGGNISAGIDEALSNGRTLTADGVTHAAASAKGAPASAADSVFSTMDDAAYAALDDVSTASVYSKGGNIANSMDDALAGGRTLTADGVTHAPASMHGAPTSAADSAFGVKNTIVRNVDKAATSVKTTATNVGTKVKTTSVNVGTKVKDTATSVGTKVKTGASSVSSKVGAAMDKTTVGSKIKAGATTFGTKIKTGATTVGTKIKTGATTVGTKIKTGATTLGTNIKTGVQNGVETVKTLNAANPTFAGKAAGLSTIANGTNVVYNAATEPNSYDYAVYSDGSNTLLQGQSVRIDSDNYQFHGSTESGKNLFTDNSGDLYYIENNTLNAVTLPNGSTANAGTLGDTFQVNLGGETINQDSTLYTGYAQSKTDYVDTLSSNIDV